MKYVYREGVIGRSRRNPKVISGELSLLQPSLVRESWKPWRYWLYRILKIYFHVIRRWVPPLGGWIEQLWCRHYEWDFYRPEDRVTIPIEWDQTTAENRARHQEWIDERTREARPPDPRSNG